MAEDLVPGANRGNRSPTLSVGGGRSSHGSKDYDDVPNDDGGSNGTVCNGNDDEMDGTVQNGNDEDAPANIGTGNKVEGPLQGQDINKGIGDGVVGALQGEDNNVVGQSLEEAVGDGTKCSNLEQLNGNVNHMAEPQDKGAVDIDDNMPLVGIFPCCVQRMAAPLGPTLVRLGNERRNASKRPPRYHTVARNKCNRDSRTV
jgi:hypothetical protein